MGAVRQGECAVGIMVPFGRPASWGRAMAPVGMAVAVALLITGSTTPAAATPGLESSGGLSARPDTPATERADEALTAPDAVTAMTVARLEGAPVEVLGERTESTSVFALPDGTMAAGISSGPVRVRTGGDGTASEDWAPIDGTLSAGDDGLIRPAANVGQLELSGGTPAGTVAEQPVTVLSMTNADGTESTVEWEGPLPEPRLEGSRAVYEDVRPDVDMVVEVTATGAEQFFVINEAPAPETDLTLPVGLSAEGAVVEPTADGGLEIRGARDGAVLGHSAVPTMWDATADADRVHPVTKPWEPLDESMRPMPEMPDWGAMRSGAEPGRQSGQPDAGTRGNGGPGTDEAAEPGQRGPAMSDQVEVERNSEKVDADSVQVELTPQAEFLDDPETVYPVVVDPAITIGAYFDTSVQSGVGVDLSTSSELLLGTWNGGATKTRSFANFTNNAVQGKTILNAVLYMYEHHSYSCSARNWQVWGTGLATTATRWTNQPAWGGHYSTSSDTRGYSSACPDGDVAANVTAMIRDAAAAPLGSAFVMGLKAENEADSYGWKRFYSTESGYGPYVWVNYNTLPTPPTALKVSGSPTGTVSGAWTNTTSPTLSATISDPDGGVIHGMFEVANASQTVIHTQNVLYLASGSVASIVAPAGLLANGSEYYFRVRVSDDIVEGPRSEWFKFGVDNAIPLAPNVASSEFPNDNGWHGEPGQAGTFTFALPGADATVTGYRWALDKAPDPAQVVSVSAGAPGTLSVTPTTAGRHVLHVQAVDRAGNVSGVTRYAFQVGRAGILTPEEGATAARRVRLTVGAIPEVDLVRFQWRRGVDSPATEIYDVPVGHLSTSRGQVWTQTWQSLPRGSGYTTWDVGQTLGFEGGPVQVRAQVSSAADGSTVYDTQWVTVTVDPDADGAASTAVGPGSVNLLTGDHSLSATDVEEFGIAVTRTASSRDTDAGLELQAERLPTNQAEGTSLAGVVNSGAVVTIATDRYHSGKTAFSVATGPVADSYAALGGDAGAMRLGLQAGRRYRITAWVYVPARTGLTLAYPRGQSLALFWKADGAYNEPLTSGAITPRPTAVNAWQRVSVDVTIPTNATEAFLRMYNGMQAGADKPVYFDDISVREVWSPFGPQWSAGTVDAAAGTAYTRITRPYDDVASVQVTGGGEIWFTSGDGVKWWPQPGAEDLALTATSATTWRLTELDGTVTDFAQNLATKDFPVTTTSPPGAAGASRHVYDVSGVPGVSRLSRIIAPIEPGVDSWPTNAQACTTTIPARGCEVVDLAYATTSTATASVFGSYAGRVSSVSVWSWDPDRPTPTMVSTQVAKYEYDDAGRLRRVWDPRITPTLTTTYEYDASGRVTSVTPSGEPPYLFTYGAGGASRTGAGDWFDPGLGRLLKVSRASLIPGTTDQLGPDNTTTVVYNVPLTRTAGGPYDLGATSLETWAQTDGPTDGTAVFGPEAPPGVTTATASTPGPDGYRSASVHYLNASGQEVNTASPAAAGAPVEGFIDTAEYDRFGNVTRTLDATNRLLALKVLPGWQDSLTAWGLDGRSTVELAQLLDTRSAYSADGLDVVTQTGPIQQLALADTGQVRTLRPTTSYTYDENKPDGAAYHLVTSTQTSGVDPSTAEVFDTVTTTYGYAPILGGSSGWVHKQPTSVTVDAGQPGALTAQVAYDDRGRATSSRRPGSTGGDAGTSVSVYYTAAANPLDSACGVTHPEWAGQPCVTKTGGPVTGEDGSRMSGELSVKRILAYNRFGSPTVVSETVTGPVDGVTVTQTRTSTTTYDAADRVTTVSIAGTGAGVGSPIATTRTVYDPSSGDVVGVQSLNPDGTVASSVSKVFDALGRLVSYTDADGGRTQTTYDRFGKPETETQHQGAQLIGSRTFTYDAAVEPRGFLTSVTDSVAGTISAVWGLDGQLESETLPGGLTLRIGYDPARVPTSRQYARTSDGVVVWADSVVENHRGQWVEHVSTTGTARYAYDRLGRLTASEDTLVVLNVCTRNTYAYDTHSNRTQATTATGGQGQVCPTAPSSTVSSTYDSADRLVSGFGGSVWTYDPLGRITTMPGVDGTGTVTNEFYVNDLVAAQEVPGRARATWVLDPIQRRSSYTELAWVNAAWAASVTKVSHYATDSDEPAWVLEDSTLPTDVTRYVSGVEGDLAVSTTLDGGRVINLVDLHGDVVGTVPIADGASQATWSELVFARSDGFGNPVPLTGAGTPNAPPARYGWLGAAQRSGEALGGVLLMGVRLYHPATGRFLSADPVPGGSASAYDYCNADPVNCTDLNGQWPSFKSVLSVVATVGEIASNIPGPIGAAAAGVSAVAYAANGNTTQALIMGATAVAALVGAGAVVRVAARAVSVARAAGQAARAAPRVARATRGIASAASRARAAVQRVASVFRRSPVSCPINSFVPGTLVVLADGTLAPIESLDTGDLVLTGDPETGEVSAQPVIAPITGTGTKHLVEVVTDAGTWTATANHPIWVDGKGWTQAADLTTGDQLVGSTGGILVVQAMHDLGWLAGQTVHNLSIAGTHTYYIATPDGNLDALVHNCPRPASSNWARDAIRSWDRGTYNNVTHSIRDHFARHGRPGQSLRDYATQGVRLAQQVGATGRTVRVRGPGGGIVSRRGQVYTTW
jgi:RHS repeat-associated protein